MTVGSSLGNEPERILGQDTDNGLFHFLNSTIGLGFMMSCQIWCKRQVYQAVGAISETPEASFLPLVFFVFLNFFCLFLISFSRWVDLSQRDR